MYKIVKIKDVPVEERSNGRYSIKRLATFSLRAPENAGFYETTIPPGGIVGNHAHETLEEALLFLDDGSINVDGKRFKLESGDLVYLERGTPHEIYGGEKGTRLIAIKFPNNIEDKSLIDSPDD